jgi:hypothetical protein
MLIEVWESSEKSGVVDKHAFTISTLGNDVTFLKDVETKHTVSMKDDGDGVEIKIDKKKIKLDYYEAVQVLILLQSNVDQRFQFRESKIIKSF